MKDLSRPVGRIRSPIQEWAWRWSAVAAVALASCAPTPDRRPQGGRSTPRQTDSPPVMTDTPPGAPPSSEPGTPPAAPGTMSSESSPAATGMAVISEIMYHPVLDDEGPEELFEFVEIHNPSDSPLVLDGWQLVGDIRFAFPAGAVLPPRGHGVVAKNRAKLASVPGYDIPPGALWGDFEGSLDNGGGRVGIATPAGVVLDAVQYDDKAPWPVGADALGAAESWLPKDRLPLESHRHRGRSLEKIRLDGGSAVDNWMASPLDGATPARARGDAPPPVTVVLARTLTRETGAGLVGANDGARLSVTVPEAKAPEAMELELYEDRLNSADEAPRVIPMMPRGAGAFEALLPGRPAGTLIRYRVRARQGERMQVVSPDPSSPGSWHAYYVSPALKAGVETYHLLLDSASWGRLWRNVSRGRYSGCTAHDTWDERVPLVFVHGNEAFDARGRYQGSSVQRPRGQAIATWPHPGPSEGPVQVMSWNLAFPRYARFNGSTQLLLNKLMQACPGLENIIEGALLNRAGIPTSDQFRYVRLHVNGGYYGYVMEYRKLGESTLEEYEGKGKPIGDLFKGDGIGDGVGRPWHDGRLSLVQADCNLSSLQRYQLTYPRVTNTWKGHDELIALIEALHKAKAAGLAAARAYLAEHWDVDALLTTFAIRNWSGTWDDNGKNYFIYRRPPAAGGKWMMLYYDFDQDFGGAPNRNPSQLSFFIGEAGNPQNVFPDANHLKDLVLKAYREEFKAKLLELSKTLLTPENVQPVVEEAIARFKLEEWRAAPAPPYCDAAARIAALRRWPALRHATLEAGIK